MSKIRSAGTSLVIVVIVVTVLAQISN